MKKNNSGFDDSDTRQRRIKQLFEDGYVTVVGDKWQLTDRGWRCLAACADRPVRPSKEDA